MTLVLMLLKDTELQTVYPMLDADFEYGLQSYEVAKLVHKEVIPSIYEVPGTDTGYPVVTDASAARRVGLKV